MSFESLAAAAFAPPPQFNMQKTPLWDGELRTPGSFTGEQSEQSTDVVVSPWQREATSIFQLPSYKAK